MFTHLSTYSKATLFYCLAVGLALVVAWLAPGLGADGAGILTMLTPLLAVLLMLLVVTRAGYQQAGWQGLGLQRAGFSQWGAALGGPLLVLSVTYSLVWLTGIGRLLWPADQSGLALIPNLLINVLFTTILALGEEIGFRGYLLPHLLTLGRTRALLLSGLLHGLWHLPLLLLTPFYHGDGNHWLIVPLFLLTLSAAGVFYGYLRLTSASIWPAALAHGAFNAFWNRFSLLTVAVGSPLVLEYLAGESGLFTLIGTVVLAAWLLTRLHRQPTTRRAPSRLVNEVTEARNV